MLVYKYYCETCDCELLRNRSADYKVSFCPTNKFPEAGSCRLKITNSDSNFFIKDSIKTNERKKKSSDRKS